MKRYQLVRVVEFTGFELIDAYETLEQARAKLRARKDRKREAYKIRDRQTGELVAADRGTP